MNSLKENKQYIIHKQSGEKLNFFISNQSLYYKIVNDYSTELIEEELIENIKYYDIDLDSKGTIHIICITTLGELYYLNFSNNQWEKKILKKFGPQSNSIDFLNILIPNNKVHIFYSFKNITNNNLYRIIHLSYYRKNWKFNYLESIIQVKNNFPYIIDYDNNGDLYFLYKKNKSDFYLRVYSNSNKSWKSLGKMKFNIDVEEIKTFLIDSKKNMHFIYKSKKSTNEIYHVYKEKNSNFNPPNSICIEESENLNLKIFEASKKLWILWKYEDMVHYKYSTDYGISWSEANTIDLQELNNFNFIGSNYRNISLNKKISTFGFIKGENLYLFGLDSLNIFEEKNIDLEDTAEILDGKTEFENEYIYQQSDEQIYLNPEEDILEKKDNDLEDSDVKLEKENESKNEYIEKQSNEQININCIEDVSKEKDNDLEDSDMKLEEEEVNMLKINQEEKKPLIERMLDFLSNK